jgi:hypothetical protein
VTMTRPPTLGDLMADPGELDALCLDCHHNTTMLMAALLPRYAANAVSLLLGRVLLFGPIGGPPMARPISMSQGRADFTAELSLRDAKINRSWHDEIRAR